jgi:hypothetical protein
MEDANNEEKSGKRRRALTGCDHKNALISELFGALLQHFLQGRPASKNSCKAMVKARVRATKRDTSELGRSMMDVTSRFFYASDK